jgi:hypothetical protein
MHEKNEKRRVPAKAFEGGDPLVRNDARCGALASVENILRLTIG